MSAALEWRPSSRAPLLVTIDGQVVPVADLLHGHENAFAVRFVSFAGIARPPPAITSGLSLDTSGKGAENDIPDVIARGGARSCEGHEPDGERSSSRGEIRENGRPVHQSYKSGARRGRIRAALDIITSLRALEQNITRDLDDLEGCFIDRRAMVPIQRS